RWKHANNENIDTIICGGYVLRVERKRTKPVAASCRPGYWRTALPRFIRKFLSGSRPWNHLNLLASNRSGVQLPLDIEDGARTTTSKNILEVPEDVRVSQISKDCRTTIMLRNIPNKVESLREEIAVSTPRPVNTYIRIIVPRSCCPTPKDGLPYDHHIAKHPEQGRLPSGGVWVAATPALPACTCGLWFFCHLKGYLRKPEMVQLSRPASVRRKDTLGNLEGESGLPNEAQKATDDGLEVSGQLRLCR
ncbi:hypothetical protein BHE90_017148, partial [Fusarium euwallaceae]